MKQLVPTVLVNKGKLTLSHMYMQIGGNSTSVPKSPEQQSAEEHLWRAKLFFNNYNRAPEHRIKIACLSGAIASAVAVQQQMLWFSENGQLAHPQLAQANRLSYHRLLKHIRNAEQHYFGIPAVDGIYYCGTTVIDGKAMLQIINGKPRRWRKNGRIKTDKPILFVVREGQVVAFDESASQAVNLAYAVREYIVSLEKWLSDIFESATLDPKPDTPVGEQRAVGGGGI